MAQVLRDRSRYVRDDDYIDDAPAAAPAGLLTLLGRLVWLVTAIILAILTLRFFFVLFGANPDNSIANFIYNVSDPLVSPFFNLFNYNAVAGIARFELFTLVAMAFYALVGGIIARLLTLGRPGALD
jgi:uncharacterized protein YggT (Ycf19 family)